MQGKKLDDNEPNKEGDVVVYGNDDNRDGVLSQDEITHSARVTQVDSEGNTTRVESKEGEGAIYDHHPRNPNGGYQAGENAIRQYFRPSLPATAPNLPDPIFGLPG